MNKKAITIIVVIGIVTFCTLAIIYAPNIMEAVTRFHKIPQH